MCGIRDPQTATADATPTNQAKPIVCVYIYIYIYIYTCIRCNTRKRVQGRWGLPIVSGLARLHPRRPRSRRRHDGGKRDGEYADERGREIVRGRMRKHIRVSERVNVGSTETLRGVDGRRARARAIELPHSVAR